MGPLLDVVIWLLMFMEHSPSLPALVIVLPLTAYPMVLLHEVGHAAMVRLRLGPDVPLRISVGRPGPAGVDGMVEFDASTATASDVLLIALAGPAASLAATVLTALAMSSTPLGSVAHALLWGCTAWNVIGLANVIPFALRDAAGLVSFRSDGRQALDAAKVLAELR
jgi:hypothetical protein